MADETMLKNSIKNGNIYNCYFIYGNDAYMKKFYVDKIIGKTADRDDVFNFTAFSDECEMAQVSNAVEQLPLMNDRKCVLLTDYDFEKSAKSEFDALKEIAETVPESTVFIIWCNNYTFDVKKSDRAKKLAACVQKGGGMAVEVNHPSLSDLKRLLVNGAQKRNIKLAPNTAQRLIENCGDDINLLRSELEKLCAYCTAQNISEINSEIIEKVCVKSVEASVFDLAGEIFTLNITAAVNTLDNLFYLKTEAAVILHSIFTSFIDAYRVYSGVICGISIPQIAKDFGYGRREFVLTKIKGFAAKMDNTKFKLCFEELTEADSRLKGFSCDEKGVLEQLVIKLVYIISKGEKIAEDR